MLFIMGKESGEVAMPNLYMIINKLLVDGGQLAWEGALRL